MEAPSDRYDSGAAQRGAVYQCQHKLMHGDLSAEGSCGIESFQQIQMIETISRKFAGWLLKQEAIRQDQVPLYEYAVFTLIFNLLPICLAFVIGLFMHMGTEGVCMMIPFIFTRKFSGGYHMQSPWKCFFSSTAALSVMLVLIRVIVARQLYYPFWIVLILSEVCIFLLSPIDTEARKLTMKEHHTFKITARIISMVFVLLSVFLYMRAQNKIAVAVGFGVVLTALLQMPIAILKVAASLRKNTSLNLKD